MQKMLREIVRERPVTQRGQLHLRGICKRFEETEVVRGVDLEVQPGTAVSLLGPSGCGKTTILRMVAGLVRPSAGQVLIDGTDVTNVPVHSRDLGMVFQNYALFPHLTAAENVAFGLEMRNMSRADISREVADALATVRMTGMERRSPAQLSGGQQQRVALARAIVTRPRILLLDEPFGALDRLMRESMQIEVLQLQRQLGITFLFVTHDQDEALTLSDRIAVLRDGRIEQVGSPKEVYERPSSLFVAEFFGELNTLAGRVIQTGDDWVVAETRYGRWRIPSATRRQGDCLIAVRARDIDVLDAASDHAISLTGHVRDVIYRGSSTLLRVVTDHDAAFYVALDRRRGGLGLGEQVRFGWQPDRTLIYPAP
jgi:spermidine/putrescine ABC transporter ATP-binding subunit